MKCEKVRDKLTLQPQRLSSEERSVVKRHLEECDPCARLADRLEIARQTLEDHQGKFTPDASFAARVVARLPQPEPILGWAALKLLPAAAALLLVLSAWVWLQTGTPAELVAEVSTDDLMSWVLENGVHE